MYSIEQLKAWLIEEGADYELIHQSKPIYSLQDAKAYYDIEKSAPTFILQSEKGLLACIVSSQYGKLNFEVLKAQFKFEKLKMADRKKIEAQTGYHIGCMPLVGHQLPCIFDKALSKYDYIYGGSGDECITLKIKPADVKRLNNLIGLIE